MRAEEIRVVGNERARGDWLERRNIIFQHAGWHFECLDDLKAAERVSRTSLGIVKVGRVERVEVAERSAEDRDDHNQKLAELKTKTDLFGKEQKDLQFLPWRIRLHWRCQRLDEPKPCPGHSASILDWGLLELARRDGIDKGRARLEELTRLNVYDLHLFMGNLFTRPNIFSIIGLWYPKHQTQTRLL